MTMDLKNLYEVGSHSPTGTDPEKGSPIYTDEAPAVHSDVCLIPETLPLLYPCLSPEICLGIKPGVPIIQKSFTTQESVYREKD